MKIVVQKRSLERALHVVRLAAVGNDESKMESHYMFKYGAGELRVYGQDGVRLAAEAPVADATVDGEDGESFTVPAWRLNQWVNAITDGDEVLTLSFTSGVVSASSKRGSGRFGSLDPSLFPAWDATYKTSVETGVVSTARLSALLAHLRHFTFDQEQHKPKYTCIGSSERGFGASDTQNVIARVSCDVLQKATLNIFFKDVSQILGFLSVKGVGEVTIRESEDRQFFVRNDGAFLSVNKWPHPFPSSTVLKDEVIHPKIEASFSISTADLVTGIKILSAFAKKDDPLVSIVYCDDHVSIRMMSGSGSSSYDEHRIPVVAQEGMEKVPTDRRESCRLIRKYLEQVSSLKGHETMKLNMIFGEKSSGVEILTHVEGDEYQTFLVFVKTVGR